MVKNIGLLALVAFPVVLFLLGLKPVEGCPPEGKRAGCYGPIGTYWTIYGAQLAFQSAAMTFGAIAAIVISIFGFFLKWKKATVFFLALAGLLSAFLIVVHLDPVIIQY